MAFAVIQKRLDTGATDALALWVVDEALVRQGNRMEVWDKRWGEVIHGEFKKLRIRKEQWKQYLKQGATWTFRWRPRLRETCDWPLEITWDNRRLAKDLPGRWLHCSLEAEFQLPHGTSHWIRTGEVFRDRDTGPRQALHRKDMLARPKPGVYQVPVAIKIQRECGGIVGVEEVRLTAEVEIVSREGHSAKLVKPLHDGAFGKAFWAGPLSSRWPDFDLPIFCDPLATGAAFEVYLMTDYRKIHLGQLTRAARLPSTTFTKRVSREELDAAKVGPYELLLEPSLSAAEESVDVEEVTDQAIRIKGIDVAG